MRIDRPHTTPQLLCSSQTGRPTPCRAGDQRKETLQPTAASTKLAVLTSHLADADSLQSCTAEQNRHTWVLFESKHTARNNQPTNQPTTREPTVNQPSTATSAASRAVALCHLCRHQAPPLLLLPVLLLPLLLLLLQHLLLLS